MRLLRSGVAVQLITVCSVVIVMSHAGQSGADFFLLRCISLGWTLSVLPWQQKIDAKNWNR